MKLVALITIIFSSRVIGNGWIICFILTDPRPYILLNMAFDVQFIEMGVM